MAKSFNILRAKMSPEARKRAEQKTQEFLKEIEKLEKGTENADDNNQEYEGRSPPSTPG